MSLLCLIGLHDKRVDWVSENGSAERTWPGYFLVTCHRCSFSRRLG